MSYLRSIEFDGTNANVFADAYGEEELMTPAKRIAGVCVRGGIKKLCVPLDPRESYEITLEDMKESAHDSDVVYVLLATKFTLPKEALVMVEDINDPFIARVYKNQIFVEGDYKNVPILATVVRKYLAKEELYEIDKLTEARDKVRRDEIGKFLVADIDLRKQTIQESINNTTSAIREARQKLVQLCSSLDGYTDTLFGIDKRRSETAVDDILKEIDEVLASSSLKELYVKNNKVYYVTGPIAIRDVEGKLHPIGDSFRVEVDMTRASIKFINLGNKLKNYSGNIHHPHTNEEGVPCLGNISTIIPEVCSTRDIMGVWQVAHSFLTSYNEHDSWGERLKYWPVVEEEENV